MIRFALFLNAIGLRRAGEWLMTRKLRRNMKGTIFERGTAHFVKAGTRRIERLEGG